VSFGSKSYVPQNQKTIFANMILWIVGISIVVGFLVAAGWRIGWLFQGRAVNYQSHILRNSYANQQTLRDQITARLGDVQTITVQIAATSGADQAVLKAQRLAIGNIVCGDAEQVSGDPLPTDQTQWVQANCSLGSISTSSPLNP
jgi:hypothetical protein